MSDGEFHARCAIHITTGYPGEINKRDKEKTLFNSYEMVSTPGYKKRVLSLQRRTSQLQQLNNDSCNVRHYQRAKIVRL